jgi:hypothetical protein
MVIEYIPQVSVSNVRASSSVRGANGWVSRSSAMAMEEC